MERKRIGLKWKEKEGKRCNGRGNEGKVGREEGEWDDEIEELRFRKIGEGEKNVRGEMGGKDKWVEGDEERIKCVGWMVNGLKIGMD